MSWQTFLSALCQRQEYELTPVEVEVLMCLEEGKCPTKNSLFAIYNQHSPIEEEAFTQRLKNIYKKFQINGKGHKLPQLYKYLNQLYIQEQNDRTFFENIGLTYVYPKFPKNKFSQAIAATIAASDDRHKQVDILQTFAPNLNDYDRDLICCLNNNVRVRILLAWPYSEAAKLRENVLRKYADTSTDEEIDIRDRTIANLETLERILVATNNSQLLDLRLYDTLPSMAIYRAGNYMLAAPFLHGSLAINTFQLELQIDRSSQLITDTLQKDFELMWHVARRFCPTKDCNWRSDLKVLFTH